MDPGLHAASDGTLTPEAEASVGGIAVEELDVGAPAIVGETNQAVDLTRGGVLDGEGGLGSPPHDQERADEGGPARIP